MTSGQAAQGSGSSGEPGENSPEQADFEKDYWEDRWLGNHRASASSMRTAAVNPHLVREVDGLSPGTVLDAGCGAGGEAIWLATAGWQVTAVDISAAALEQAADRARTAAPTGMIEWVQADLTTWAPATGFDLVTTHYAHSAIPQLDLYERLATWVDPGGTLLIVGHLHQAPSDDPSHRDDGPHDHGHTDGQHLQDAASVTADGILARLDESTWHIITALESARTVRGPGGGQRQLRDVVVRARRRR